MCTFWYQWWGCHRHQKLYMPSLKTEHWSTFLEPFYISSTKQTHSFCQLNPISVPEFLLQHRIKLVSWSWQVEKGLHWSLLLVAIHDLWSRLLFSTPRPLEDSQESMCKRLPLVWLHLSQSLSWLSCHILLILLTIAKHLLALTWMALVSPVLLDPGS